RRRHTRWPRDWSSDVCSSDLQPPWEPHEESAGSNGIGAWALRWGFRMDLLERRWGDRLKADRSAEDKTPILPRPPLQRPHGSVRSEERRVGNEWRSGDGAVRW